MLILIKSIQHKTQKITTTAKQKQCNQPHSLS